MTTIAPSTPRASAIIKSLQEAGEDFEWYPTTDTMIQATATAIRDALGEYIDFHGSIMDIGAGDGRVLIKLADALTKSDRDSRPLLYAIEKSPTLVKVWPEEIVPMGTDLFEQNLACLQVDYIFCNPPYSEFEAWAATIIESGYAAYAYLVIPRRWKDSDRIADAIKRRGATTRVVFTGSFDVPEADRRARAKIDIVEVSFPLRDEWNRRDLHEKVIDPFDQWFDENVDVFDKPEEVKEEEAARDIARLRQLETIGQMVEAYTEEYARMESNYRAIFQLDYAILRELGVEKDNVRKAIKEKMKGLKNKYWSLLFEKLGAITSRLATQTKQSFLERLTGRAGIAFTARNAYMVVLWAIQHANQYFDQQVIDLFRELSTHDGVLNYKSNQKVWQHDGWRYRAENHSHYALDYRFVKHHYSAIRPGDHRTWDYPGDLHKSCHDLIADIVAVLYNLGFSTVSSPSLVRQWEPNQWQDWRMVRTEGKPVTLFQVKAFKNGNMHFRFLPEAIKALNIEAGRLLGWLRSHDEVVRELGYTEEDAKKYYRSNLQLTASNVKLLTAE